LAQLHDRLRAYRCIRRVPGGHHGPESGMK
jgi:hypothetical protein